MAQRTASEARLCRLQYAVGRVETCPEERCPFWEPGGAVLEGRCVFERLGASDNPELASRLLRIRKTLESARTNEEDEGAWRLFYRLLNEGTDLERPHELHR
jgi:hypothetical protein